jgi:glycosyltransferase involved in cell wall biosynthesis/predicted O-methyltransferase YrrM
LEGTDTTGPPPAVSVVVTAYRDSPALRRCLAQVRGQASELGGEVVLAFNAAESALDAGARGALSSLVDRIVFEPQIGKSHALNRALRACRGEIVAFTDDDALPRAGWLRALVAPLREGEAATRMAGCGGPVIPVYREKRPPRWYRALAGGPDPTHFLGPRHDLGTQPLDYGYGETDLVAPIGANCAYRRELLRVHGFLPELGPNRETGLRGGEDIELGARLLWLGRRILYCPDAVVEHPVAAERMTRSFVRRSYFVHGVAEVRLRRALGREVPTRRQLTRRLRRARRRARRSLLPWRRRWVEHRMESELLRGMLSELERAPARRGAAEGGEGGEARLKRYRHAARGVAGWMDESSAAVWDALLDFQRRRGIRGDALEVGVWHGRSAALLGLHRDVEREQLLLVDNQPRPAEIRAAFARAGLAFDAGVQVLGCDSRRLLEHPLLKGRGAGFRWIHIDGEHSGEAVDNDLGVACELLQPDGIVSVDDFFLWTYPQVTRAVFRFLEARPDALTLFLCGFNKAYLARPAFAREYLAFCAAELRQGLAERGVEASLSKTALPQDLNCFGVGPPIPGYGVRGPDSGPKTICW